MFLAVHLRKRRQCPIHPNGQTFPRTEAVEASSSGRSFVSIFLENVALARDAGEPTGDVKAPRGFALALVLH